MDSGDKGKKPVRVTIFGQSYTLRVAEDQREVEELARRVDSLMANIAARSGNTEASRVAVLACLHLLDRLRAVEQELASLKQRVDQKTERLSLLLDQALGGPE